MFIHQSKNEQLTYAENYFSKNGTILKLKSAA